ncbi:(deoxy)nucleoside triphosphate pyrophosphohydrolase [Haliangium ochraceum]|uniref:8-oxo-dGTP diphosphatase n=1 Tax=Haliangium ochraceum (strain DSM 14365 / JCM 11303 / SMP-2) TaxID=502025 RepID=D0LZK6_HALO1|nr:(deoxy)nucleoside triphosphate pyrophosphohydrolase [Haliangium ochraceum]ACY17985.1 NUDIX hydrolase [Haliangium ochraceum DSM 14365]
MGKEVIRVVAAVIERGGRYLITQRKSTAVLPLLWEFPGGRVESGEGDEDALKREIRERIGVDIAITGKLGEHHHAYPHYDVHMTMFSCQLEGDEEPQAANVNDLRWVSSAELRDYEFPPADETTMNRLLGRDAN